MSLYLVRHAHADRREDHDGPDDQRPLSPRGREQAGALHRAFDGRTVTRVLSSPTLRCRQSVGPLALARGLEVEDHPALAEGRVPLPARYLLDDLARQDVDAVLCSHGDVIPWLVDSLAADGVELRGGPGCHKGSVWELEVRDGRVSRARYHPEPAALIAH